MCQPGLECFLILMCLAFNRRTVGRYIVMPIYQMKELRCGETQPFVQGRAAHQGQASI